MTNWSAVPFFRLLLPLSLGIISGEYLSVNIWWILGAFLVFFLFICLLALAKITYQYRTIFGVLLYVCLGCIGHSMLFFRQELNNANHFQSYLVEEKPNRLQGSITTLSSSDKFIKAVVAIDSIIFLSNTGEEVSGNLLVYLPMDTMGHQLRIGDTLWVEGYVQRMRSPLNPLSFDFSRYWHLKNVHYQVFCKADNWGWQASSSFSLKRWSVSSQQYFVEILRKHLPTQSEFAIAAALVTGYKDELSEELRETYSATGSIHVLAVSGLHTGFVYFIVWWLLKQVRIQSRWWKFVQLTMVLGALWLFAFITGSSPSVLRASTMFSVLALGRYLSRDGNIYNSLCASAFILLCANPYLLFDLGFQLSYLAVAGIVYFQPIINKWWYLTFSPGQYIWQMVSVSLAAQITTLPLTVYCFHRIPLYFWLSGLVVVPAASIILPLGVLLFVVDGIPWIGEIVGYVLYGTIWLMNALVYLIESLPSGVIEGLWLGSSGVGLLLLATIALIEAIESRVVKWWYIGLGAFVLVLAQNVYQQVVTQSQHKQIVYNIPNAHAVDVFSGKDVYSYTTTGLSSEKLLFAAENFRLAHKSSEKEKTTIDVPIILESGGQRLAMYYSKLLPREKQKVDYLVLGTPNYGTTLQDIQAYYDFEILIIDGMTPRWLTQQWVEKYGEQIEIYNTWDKGAFEY